MSSVKNSFDILSLSLFQELDVLSARGERR